MTDYFFKYLKGMVLEDITKKEKIHRGGNQTQEGDAMYSKQNIYNRQKMREIVGMMLKGIP